MNIIGSNVKRLRKIHNLNQVEFAQMVGVSQGSLSDIEAGKSKSAVETVISMHEKFGCSLERLLKGTDSQNSGVAFSSSGLSPVENRLPPPAFSTSLSNPW